MNSDNFKNMVECCHLQWLSSVFHLKINRKHGIDLIHNTYGIELKSRYMIYSERFAIHSYQVQEFRLENLDRDLFWCFLCYDLSKSPREIRKEKIEDLITLREAWFLEWDWIRQFPISNRPKTGPYIYVGTKDFKEKVRFHDFYRGKGFLHVPINTILEETLR